MYSYIKYDAMATIALAFRCMHSQSRVKEGR